MIKSKKWLIKNVKDNKIEEYTLKLDEVPYAINKIIHYLKICSKFKPLKEEQKNFGKSALGPFEENIIEENKKNNSIEIMDNNKSNKILEKNKNPNENMNKYYINLEDKRKKNLKIYSAIKMKKVIYFIQLNIKLRMNMNIIIPILSLNILIKKENLTKI